MSLMAMSAPRSSVFTFESTVHSSHVLRCLDEQRRRDTLCDVTVVVEGQSFRAHRSVLASCSEYFTHRIPSLTQHGAVITLPQEVTAAGFEPLLKFAYTSKLLFGKDDVLEIRNSASILGFRDLDEACFDFLLPKFFSTSKASTPFPRKTCCKKKCKRRLSNEEGGTDSDDILLDEKEVKPVTNSSPQQEVPWPCNKSVNNKMGSQNSASTPTPVAEGTNDYLKQCPKYRRQLACEKETCSTEKSLNNPVTVIREDCDRPCSPCSSSSVKSKNKTEADFRGNSSYPTLSMGSVNDLLKSEIDGNATDAGTGQWEADVVKRETNDRRGKWSKKEVYMDMDENFSLSDRPSAKAVSSAPRALLGDKSAGLIFHHCPMKTFNGGLAVTGSLGQERVVMDITEDKEVIRETIQQKAEEQVEAERRRADDERDPGRQGRGKEGQRGCVERAALSVNSARERSIAEREEAEHLAKRLGSDGGQLFQPSFQDPDAGSSSDTGSGRALSSSSECLKFHVNPGSKSASCPFFQDLVQSKCIWKGAEVSECEGTSQSGLSSLNSGEDGDSETETEGDSESYTRERAIQVQLPFSVDWIVDLSRNDFQQLLKQQVFTREQLDFVHDMRRRSKNRLAAQRCRKRKLDCIFNLQCEISKLKTEREKLIMEKSQLNHMKLKTFHSVSVLCQRVCSEANLQPEQLQVLAKYTTPDCPLSSVFPHIDALLSQHGFPLELQASLSACSAGVSEHAASEGVSSSSSRDTADGQH